MYNGIGLSTARGTGTNGYVTANAASLPKSKKAPIALQRHQDIKPQKARQANTEILEHEKKRQIEIKVTQWAEEQGLLDSE
jgi:serine/arginine repetitive matrix protein 2